MAAGPPISRLLLAFFLSGFYFPSASSEAGNLGHPQDQPDAQVYPESPKPKQSQDALLNPLSKLVGSFVKNLNRKRVSPQPTEKPKTQKPLVEITIKWPNVGTLSPLKPKYPFPNTLVKEGISSILKSLNSPKASSQKPSRDRVQDQAGRPPQSSVDISRPEHYLVPEPSTGRTEPAQQIPTQTGPHRSVLHQSPVYRHPYGQRLYRVPQPTQSRIQMFQTSQPAHGHRGHPAYSYQPQLMYVQHQRYAQPIWG